MKSEEELERQGREFSPTRIANACEIAIVPGGDNGHSL